MEDLIAVIDGRAALLTEVRREREPLRAYLQAEIRNLLATRGFLGALPGYLPPDAASQSRIDVVLERLEGLATN